VTTATREEQTGAVTIQVEGKPYTLVPDFNALCELQTITGKHPIDVMTLATAEFDRDGVTITRPADLTMARACIWAYLQDRHADEIKTLRDAGRWIERAGGLEVVDRALMRVGELNAVEGADGEAAPAGDPPPAAAAGSGASS